MKTDPALPPDTRQAAGRETNREPIPHLTPEVRLSRSSAGMAVTTMTS